MRKINIPYDSANPKIKAQIFIHNGEKKPVPLGVITDVEDWVFDENPEYLQYEVIERKSTRK